MAGFSFSREGLSNLPYVLLMKYVRKMIDIFNEQIDQFTVKTLISFTADDAEAIFYREGVFIYSLAHQCFKDIYDGDDARNKGDILSAQSAGIAATIPPFMVVLGNQATHLDELGRGLSQDFGTDGGVGSISCIIDAYRISSTSCGYPPANE